MNNITSNNYTNGTSALQPATQITRNINGVQVILNFSSTPNYQVMEIVQSMLINSYVTMIEKQVADYKQSNDLVQKTESGCA